MFPNQQYSKGFPGQPVPPVVRTANNSIKMPGYPQQPSSLTPVQNVCVPGVPQFARPVVPMPGGGGYPQQQGQSIRFQQGAPIIAMPGGTPIQQPLAGPSNQSIRFPQSSSSVPMPGGPSNQSIRLPQGSSQSASIAMPGASRSSPASSLQSLSKSSSQSCQLPKPPMFAQQSPTSPGFIPGSMPSGSKSVRMPGQPPASNNFYGQPKSTQSPSKQSLNQFLRPPSVQSAGAFSQTFKAPELNQNKAPRGPQKFSIIKAKLASKEYKEKFIEHHVTGPSIKLKMPTTAQLIASLEGNGSSNERVVEKSKSKSRSSKKSNSGSMYGSSKCINYGSTFELKESDEGMHVWAIW